MWSALRARLLFALPLFTSLVTILSGQSRPGRPEPELANSFGTVVGHVYVAASNVPARLVYINLQPLQLKQERYDYKPGTIVPLPFTVYQTGLDGSYVIPHVAPGDYYVVVNAPGFLSPFAEFTNEELRSPSPEVAQRIAATLPAIRVAPNATTTHDVRLQRGATLGGTVRFDDGTPFYGAGVFLQRRGVDEKWVNIHSYSGRPTVDAEGRWERTGLIAGEYRIQIKLELNNRKQSYGVGDNGSSSSFTKYELDYYLGDTARGQSAKTVKLEENEQAKGQDITIPISKLHALSGAVVDAANSQPLNAGTLRLAYADTGESIATTTIDPETRTYSFPFVPEGEYKLSVEGPAEARFEAPREGEGDPNFPERDRRRSVLHPYLPGEMLVIVQGEMSGINLSVQAKSGGNTSP